MPPKRAGNTTSPPTGTAARAQTLLRVRGGTRFAAVGLLALAMMLPLAGCATPEVDQFIADARSQTETIGDDLTSLTTRLSDLPDTVRSEVTGAVDSAQAATDEARAALADTTDYPERSTVALADAQVALDAAAAQVRHAIGVADEAGANVADDLRQLQMHLDELRGETSRAGE